jgi:urease accessory protein
MKLAIHRALKMLAVLLVPSAAFAHPMKGVGDFYAGMLHPVTTIETILPLIGLSLLAGQQNRKTAVKILVAFPAAILFGACLSLLRSVPPSIGIADLVITVVIGLLIAAARPWPSALPISIGVLLGVAIGWANATEMTSEVSAARFIAGLTVAGLLMTTYGIGLVRRFRVEWSQIAVRVVGSWLAGIGILVLGLR